MGLGIGLEPPMVAPSGMVGSEDGQRACFAQVGLRASDSCLSAPLVRWVSEPLTFASQHLCSREENGTGIPEEEPASLMSLSAPLCKGTVRLSRRKDLVWAYLLRAGPWELVSFPRA